MVKKKVVKKEVVKKTRKKESFINKLFKALWNYGFKWIFASIGWVVVKLFKLLSSLFRKMTNDASNVRIKKKKLYFRAELSKIRVIETIKGNYSKFWDKLNKSDSMIGIILGARGSGKTAVALSILENLKDSNKRFFAMGFSNAELPKWMKVVDKIDDLDNNSYVVIDEGGILFSSRDAMSSSNKMLSELLLIARHKNLTIFFISQNSSNLEVNTLRQADFLILKKSSLLQTNFERKIVSKIYEEYAEKFAEHSSFKGISLIYSDSFLGFVDNELPSFWSENVSKGFK